MPNLPMHMHLASQAAQRLAWEWLDENAGSLLLGSTAPDIRIMTKWPRERTHFAPLSGSQVGDGPRTMFRLNPELANLELANPELDGSNGASNATRAFLVGYVSHLVADETWIADVYRPNFDPPPGRDAVAGTDVEANLWDRALQLDMDLKSAPLIKQFMEEGPGLTGAEVGVDVGFLEEASLQEWGGWVQEFLGWGFSWDRLKRALNRMYRDDDSVQRVTEAFIQELPSSLERVYSKIPRKTIDAFQEKALEETLVQIYERWGETRPTPDAQ